MARLGAAVLTALVMLLVAAPAGAAERCGDAKGEGSKIVKRSSEAVVFSRASRVYGCLYARNRSRRLPRGELAKGQVETRVVAIAGHFVAYGTRDARDPYANLVVFDLSDGGILLDQPAGGGGPSLVRIALKRNGSVAWTASWCNGCRYMNGYGTGVFRWEGGPVDTLDSWGSQEGGDAIDLKSLRLSADRRSVSWETEKGVLSAPLR